MANKYEQFSKAHLFAENARRDSDCRNKRAYDTRDEAVDGHSIVYRCFYCSKWHRSSSYQSVLHKIKIQNGTKIPKQKPQPKKKKKPKKGHIIFKPRDGETKAQFHDRFHASKAVSDWYRGQTKSGKLSAYKFNWDKYGEEQATV